MSAAFCKTMHIISKFSTYTLIFCLLFFAQKYSIGLLFRFNSAILFNKFYLHEIVFSITSFLLILKFIRAGSPYEKYLQK
jgi:hypothetical protein